MTNLTKLVIGLVLVFGLTNISNAASVLSFSEGFKVYQSDTEETSEDEEKKPKEGEEEEPDC